MNRFLLSGACFMLMSGCAAIGGSNLPKTPGEVASSYGYIPLDPLPVHQIAGPRSCRSASSISASEKAKAAPSLIESFPDLAIRFAIGEFSANGQLQFGPSKVTSKGSAYRAVLDYVNVDVIPVEFRARKLIREPGKSDTWVPLSFVVDRNYNVGAEIIGYEAIVVRVGMENVKSGRMPSRAGINPDDDGSFEIITFPIYVGVGLRLSADIRVLEGGIELNGLGTIGAQADAKNLTGTLTVQTLGITGKAIATTLPLPSKLDQTTIENGILSIGTSRAILYNTGNDGVTPKPRVVGLYSPVGSDSRLINAVYSELSGVSIFWQSPCGH